MKRNASFTLGKWYEENDLRPVLLTGLKGVGKTWLATDFSASFFERHIYINFETDGRAKAYFEALPSKTGLWEALGSYYEMQPEIMQDILFIFDEISFSERFCRLLLEYVSSPDDLPLRIIAISSICDDQLTKSDGFFRLKLNPLSFDEFLNATRHEWYTDIITAHFENLKHVPGIVHNDLMDIFDQYLRIGGMPSVINEYLLTERTDNIEEIQMKELRNLRDSLHDVPNDTLATRMLQIYDSAFSQFSLGPGRFIFSLIRKGVTYNYFKEAIDELVRRNLLLKSTRMPINPSSDRRADITQVQLIPTDTGLINAILRRSGLEEDKIHEILLRAYISNCVSNQGFEYGYWESQTGSKVEHVININENKVPIELLKQNGRRGKNIAAFCKHYGANGVLIMSDMNFEADEEKISIPLYASFCLNELNLPV